MNNVRNTAIAESPFMEFALGLPVGFGIDLAPKKSFRFKRSLSNNDSY